MTEAQAGELIWIAETMLYGFRVLLFVAALGVAGLFGSLFHRWVRGF